MRLIVAMVFLFSCAPNSRCEPKTLTSGSEHVITFDEVLSWLPADTETITVAHGPFAMPDLRPSNDEAADHELSTNELSEMFEDLAMGLFGIKDGVLQKHLAGKPVLLAMEGARRFRAPSGLGGALYEGCQIALFEPGAEVSGDGFMTGAAKSAKRFETVENEKIAVFTQTLENDEWTFLVTFPKPNLVIVATDEGYLREVLRRMNGGKGTRALSTDLPEWKFVNTDSPVWALRHFDPKQPQENFTSPFYDSHLGPVMDRHSIGEVLQFNSRKSRTAQVIFVSSDQTIISKLKTSALMHSEEPAAPNLNVSAEQLEPGVIAISYDLKRSGAAELFFFIVSATLGHAVFV